MGIRARLNFEELERRELPSLPAEPLLYSPNLQYEGAFRVPAGQFGQDASATFEYGGSALAFNPAHHSLFAAGLYGTDVAEISIPSVVSSSNPDDLQTADVLQPFRNVLDNVPNNTLADQSCPNAIGGLAVVGGRLLGSVYNTYDGNGTAPDAHFVFDSLNLSTANLTGYFQVGDYGGGLTSGYMAPIPPEWRPALGMPYLTGQADLNIISRTSNGPGVFGFNPKTSEALGTSEVSPVTPYLYYPSSAPLGSQGLADPAQNWTSRVAGVAFVPGSRSVLFFGSTGTNFTGYGEGADFGDGNRPSRGSHSLGGDYAFQVWAYDANDLVAAKEGTMAPWDIKPYDVWNFDFPISTANKVLSGVTFDPVTSSVYVCLQNADAPGPYDSLPLIEVFHVDLTGSSSGPLAPQVGTLAVTPDDLVPGPVQAGSSVLLTAGNVYARSPDAVVQVAFYVDGAFIGYGTADGQNWRLETATSGLSSGDHVLSVQAVDAAGLLSDPISAVLTVA